MLLLRERPELKILIIEKAAAFSRRVDRKSTRLNSSHSQISYAVFCLKKKKQHPYRARRFHSREIYFRKARSREGTGRASAGTKTPFSVLARLCASAFCCASTTDRVET